MSLAKDRLDQRLAEGEISVEEYERLKRLIYENEQVDSFHPGASQPTAPKQAARAASSRRSDSGLKAWQIVLGILAVLLIGSILYSGARDLKVVELGTDGLFMPDVVAVVHNEGTGGYFNFEAISEGGSRLCSGGRTYIAANERRRIRFSCSKMISYSGDTFTLRWTKE